DRLRPLGQISGLRCARACRKRTRIAADEARLPFCERDEAERGAHERCLARAVGAEQCDDIPALHGEAYVLGDDMRAEANGSVGEIEKRAHASPPRAARRAAMSANTGPPSKAAATPSFNSASVGKRRTPTSAQTSMAPPASALGTSKRAGSWPTSARTR